MNKRILSVVLVALLAVALVIGAVVVSAADDVKTENIERYAERGGNVRLVEKISKSLNVQEDLTIDLYGYTLTGNITVAAGKTLTITDSYKGGKVEGTINLVNAPKGKGTTTLNATAGTIEMVNTTPSMVENTSTSSINVNGATIGTVYVNSGVTLTVASGTITNVEVINHPGQVGTLAYPAGKAVVNGGTITTLKALNGSDVTLNGGTVTTLTATEQANVEVSGATVTTIGKADGVNGQIDVYAGTIGAIKSGANVYVDASTPYGVVLQNVDKTANVNVINAFLANGKPEDISGIDYRRTAYVYSVDKWVYSANKADDKTVEVRTLEGYIIGSEIIEQMKPDSGKVQPLKKDGSKNGDEVSYFDTIKVIKSPKVELQFTVKSAGVTIETEENYAKNGGRSVYVNGYELGSTLQKGGTEAIHDWATTITPATKAGERDCSKKYVLQPYFEDKNNPTTYYGKPDADGKLAAIYNEATDKDGPVTGSGHKLTFVPAKSATATTPGYDAYLKCDNCGKCFAIEALSAGIPTTGDNYKAAAAYEIADPIARNPVADTTAAPAETTAAPAETTAAPAETTKAPAETTAAPETQAPTPVNPSETGDNGMNALVWVIVLGAAITGVAVAGKSVLASKKH